MNTAKTLDDRLDKLVHEIKEIKKELIADKIARAGTVRERSATWIQLGEKISAKWDEVPAVEEISSQREKTW